MFSGPKPFRGRFNPKLQKRPERTGDGTWLDHQAWTKIVMAGMIGIIVYFTIHRPANHETPLAKQSEFLNGKRSQNTVCPPSYKTEIQNLGNESKYYLNAFKYSFSQSVCYYLTPNRPVIHTCFTYPILNMDDFSALYGPLGCIDSTQKVKGNSLHAG